MPTVSLYHHGFTSGMPPQNNSHTRAKRGDIKGWSESAARNNARWLRSVNINSLTGIGYAFTLTLRDCPESADVWRGLYLALFKRLERRGLIRIHWVTEWQSRGVPHLHGVAYFPDPDAPENIDKPFFDINHLIQFNWCDIAGKYGASPKGQHVVRIDNVKGWFMYMAKHQSRGARHYQRCSENVPEGWEKTGRVWGYRGDWVTDEPLKFALSNEAFWSLRRIVRCWRVSDARSDHPDLCSARIVSARKMLRCGARRLSSVRGLSEWISQEEMLTLILFLRSQGHGIGDYMSERDYMIQLRQPAG